MIIYKATNTVNGKVYIGLTTRTLKQRKREHQLSAEHHNSISAFHYAIRKHGFEAFIWEEIDNAMFHEDLLEKEKYWIDYYDTFKNGYNPTLGGEGTIGAELPKGEDSHSAIYTNEQIKKVLDIIV